MVAKEEEEWEGKDWEFGLADVNYYMCVLVTQSCLTLCGPMDWSWQCSSVRGILQARILEWGAMPPSKTIIYRKDKQQGTTVEYKELN